MSKEHTWAAAKVECITDFSVSPTPVCNIYWKLTTKNTENYVYTSISNGYVQVDITPEEATALSEEAALALLLSTLGDRLQTLEDENATILDGMIVPVIPVLS
jgi:hypothetical protein